MRLKSILSGIYQNDPGYGGAVLGLMITVPYLLLDYLASLLFDVNPIPVYSATLVVSHVGQAGDYLLGMIADLIAGSFLGFGVVMAFERTNYRYLLGKCLGIGVVLWVLHVSIIPKLWEPQLLGLMNRPTVYMALVNHVLWGIGFGFILQAMRQSGLAE